MAKRYEVYESLKNAGKFNVFDVSKGRFVRRGLPKDSAEVQADKLNALFPLAA
ncbi:hypothetical protein [Devosia ginsengisoli]|uniref:hypothetical protein n=1 Tax=Devosia ginsengisoli TaxID=400770 RepID=UPI0016482B9D|nr:hypothetical protein [Devosia ginsengisoli]